MLRATFLEHTDVNEVIGIVVKYWILSSTTLADMMGVVRYNASRWSWHKLSYIVESAKGRFSLISARMPKKEKFTIGH